jgi:hypothetical protein
MGQKEKLRITFRITPTSLVFPNNKFSKTKKY